MSDDELSRFKQEINLGDFAASYGYELDKRESSEASTTMRHANGDKIIVAVGDKKTFGFISPSATIRTTVR